MKLDTSYSLKSTHNGMDTVTLVSLSIDFGGSHVFVVSGATGTVSQIATLLSPICNKIGTILYTECEIFPVYS